MKKLISLLLALACIFACAFAFTACGEEEEPPTPAPTYAESATAFITAYNAMSASDMKATVTLNTAEGELTSVYTITKNNDGTTTIAYAIEEFAGLDTEADTVVKEGSVTSDAQGNYSDGGAVSGKIGAKGVNIDIDSDKITNYSVSSNTLRITVKADDTASVLGTALPETVVVVTLEEGAVASISLNYTDSASNVVTIVCEY